MTNTPESDTMKSLLQTAKDNGAKTKYDVQIIDDCSILFSGEAQLLATFNAWSAQQGWKLVPIEPTDEMFIMARQSVERHYGEYVPNKSYIADIIIETIYKAMLSASPIKG